MAKTNWKDETRTATEYVRDAGNGNLWELARQIGIKPERLWTWVSDPSRGFRMPTMVKVRNHLRLPIVALMQRHRPIGEVVREEEEATR